MISSHAYRTGLLALMSVTLPRSVASQAPVPAPIPRVMSTARPVETVLPAASADLERPLKLRHVGSLLIVNDAGSSSIKAFRTSGELAWQSGRRGSGPGEFQEPMSLAVVGTDRVVVADFRLARVTLLSAEGKIDSAFSLKRQLGRLFPYRGDTLLATTLSDSLFVKYVGRERVGVLALPASLAFLDTVSIMRGYDFVQTPKGNIDLLFIYSGQVGEIDKETGKIQLASGPAAAAWPADRVRQVRLPNGRMAIERGLPSDVRPVAIDIAATAEFAYVLTFPSQQTPQFLDFFRRSPLRYVCSVQLKDYARSITALSGNLYLLRDDPEPQISRLTFDIPASSGKSRSPCPGN